MTAVYAVAAVWLVVTLGSWWVAHRGHRNDRRRRIRSAPRLDPLTPTWPEPASKRGWP